MRGALEPGAEGNKAGGKGAEEGHCGGGGGLRREIRGEGGGDRSGRRLCGCGKEGEPAEFAAAAERGLDGRGGR